MNAAILVGVMSAVTILLRFLPFFVFPKKTPEYITYLGKVLPSAIIGMLVVYCLKDVHFTSRPFGILELIAAICVILLQIRKRSMILSILSGTVVYMVLIRVMF